MSVAMILIVTAYAVAIVLLARPRRFDPTEWPPEDPDAIDREDRP